MVKKVLVAVALSSLLVGCGFTKQDPSVMQDQAISAYNQRIACEKRKEVEAQSEASIIAKLGESAQMMYMALRAQAKTVAAATGHKVDECDTGSNINDVLITEVKEKNASLRAIVPDVVKATAMGTVAYKGLSVLDSAVKNAGNHTNTTNSGDGSSSQYEHNQVTSNTTQNTSADGDGASNNTVSPSVTGPDKSSTSETIVEAPKVPEVKEPEAEVEEPVVEEPVVEE